MPQIAVLDSTMYFEEAGAGRAVVLLHGNPTTSRLWHGVIELIPGRRLAPDLIGMGRSGRPDIDYGFEDSARYLDAWIDKLDLEDIVLVGQDWGGALAMDWANRHRGRARGIVLMETILQPMEWDVFPESARPFFKAMRTPGRGEDLVLQQNLLIERALPSGIRRTLAPEELERYAARYATPESRRALLAWARSMPLAGEPPAVVERVEAYALWLTGSPEVPKLLLSFDAGPGIMIGPELVEWCRQQVSSIEIEHLGPAGHHAPEDQPEAIAHAITRWLKKHDLSDRVPALDRELQD